MEHNFLSRLNRHARAHLEQSPRDLFWHWALGGILLTMKPPEFVPIKMGYGSPEYLQPDKGTRLRAIKFRDRRANRRIAFSCLVGGVDREGRTQGVEPNASLEF